VGRVLGLQVLLCLVMPTAALWRVSSLKSVAFPPRSIRWPSCRLVLTFLPQDPALGLADAMSEGMEFADSMGSPGVPPPVGRCGVLGLAPSLCSNYTTERQDMKSSQPPCIPSPMPDPHHGRWTWALLSGLGQHRTVLEWPLPMAESANVRCWPLSFRPSQAFSGDSSLGFCLSGWEKQYFVLGAEMFHVPHDKVFWKA
jgi:hypothetical protein